MPNRSQIKIYQIHFRPEQQTHLEAAFHPFDNAHSAAPEQMEFRVFRDAYQRGQTQEAEYTGFVSWKFRQKTQLSGEGFLEFIVNNPGYDVYFINPFPGELIWQNVWVQGDHFHPGLLTFTQRIFERVGHKVDLASLRQGSDTAAYCNYWVGNQRFWERYMEYSEPLFQALTAGLSEEEESFLWKRADQQIDASYFPFVFERVFSTLLSTDSSIRALGYRYPESELRSRLAPHLCELTLASYCAEDGRTAEANEHLLASLRLLHAKTRQASSRPLGLRDLYERGMRKLGFSS